MEGGNSDFAVKLLGLPVDHIRAQCHKSGFSLFSAALKNTVSRMVAVAVINYARKYCAQKKFLNIKIYH